MMRLLVALTIALAALAACSRGAENAAQPTATVQTAAVTTQTLDETITAYGQVEFNPAAVRTVTATFEAQVAELHVSVGEAVQLGQPIVTLVASATTRLDLDRLAREARLAVAAHGRMQRLRADGLTSDSEVEAAAAAAATARDANANLERLTAGGRITLAAPVSGVIDSLPVAPGALVAAGGTLASLGSTSVLNARLGVEVEDVQRIEPGAPIRLTGLHEGGASFATMVASIDRRVEYATRLAALIAALPAGSPVLPGEAVKGEIAVGSVTNATVAPRAALLYEGDQPYVYVVIGGAASRRPVTVGLEQADVVQLTTGVRPGERVVVEGGAALSDGMATVEAPAVQTTAQ